MSKQYWHSVDWNVLNREPLFRGLELVTDNNRGKRTQDVRREGEGMFAGTPARIQLLEDEKRRRFRWRVHIGFDADHMKGLGEEKCASMLALLQGAFGPPRARHETSTPMAGAVEKRVQWDVGVSRLTFHCTAFELTTDVARDNRLLLWSFGWAHVCGGTG